MVDRKRTQLEVLESIDGKLKDLLTLSIVAVNNLTAMRAVQVAGISPQQLDASAEILEMLIEENSQAITEFTK